MNDHAKKAYAAMRKAVYQFVCSELGADVLRTRMDLSASGFTLSPEIVEIMCEAVKAEAQRINKSCEKSGRLPIS
jgi:hypothetical protein